MTAATVSMTVCLGVLAGWWLSDLAVEAGSRSALLDGERVSARRLVDRFGDRLLPRRRARSTTDDVAAFLESVSEGLRAGLSLPQTLAAAQVAPALEPELSAVRNSLRHGVPLATALDEWCKQGVRDAESGDRSLAAAVLRLAARHGGSTARSVDDAARRLRSRADLRRQARAHAAQATASAVVVSLAPVAFLFLSATSDDRTMAFLTTTAPGLICLAAGLGLDAVGFVWMHRLVRRAAP